MKISTLIMVIVMITIGITQAYFGRKRYHNEKSAKQYHTLNVITAIVLFILMIVTFIILIGRHYQIEFFT